VSIRIPAGPDDHPGIVALVRDVVRGTAVSARPALVRVVRIDGWFGERYLGWSEEHTACEEPPFPEDRIAGAAAFRREGDGYEPVEPPAERPASVVSVWFSSTPEDVLLASLMGHVEDPRFAGAWHASLGLEDGSWTLKKGVGIDEERLRTLAARGR